MTTGGLLAILIPVLVAMLGAVFAIMQVLGGRIDQLDRNVGARFADTGTRFDDVNRRFDDMGGRIDRVETRMSRLESRQDETLDRLRSVDVRLKVLEQRPA